MSPSLRAALRAAFAILVACAFLVLGLMPVPVFANDSSPPTLVALEPCAMVVPTVARLSEGLVQYTDFDAYTGLPGNTTDSGDLVRATDTAYPLRE